MSVAMTPVTSSNVHSLGQNDPHLHVQFKNADGSAGALWEYEGAGHHHGPMLEEAQKPGGSVGKYLNANVKGKYPGRRIS